MNICIINDDMLPQHMGGIKRVISILVKEWENECNIVIISVAPIGTRYDIFGKAKQRIFPNTKDILSCENIEYFKEVIQESNIDIILQPYANNEVLTRLCVKIKQELNTKLFIAVHFAITYQEDILKSYFFNRYRIGGSIVKWIKEILLYLKYLFITKRNIREHNNAYYRFIIENSNKIILLSESHINTLKQIYKSNNINNVICINNPAIISTNNKNTCKSKKIIWCGRVECSAKRADRIVDIWKEIAPKYPDWELIIIGSGDIEHFRKICQEHNIPNITFAGSCDPTEFYKQGEIICMTSSTEGWGMVLIEAMLHGCVPIAYNSYTSLQDIITENYNGFTVTPYNKKEYIKKLRMLMDDKKLRERFSKTGYESIKRFDHKTIAKKWLDIFSEEITIG